MSPIGPIDPENGHFQGLLLVAHPDLKDPNFRRSVLFLPMHDANTGAMGFVLNRPLGKSAADLLPGHEQQALLRQIPVYLGGPVGHGQMSFANVDWDAKEQTLRLENNLSLDEAAERLAADPHSVRAFVGYAGWAAGQLEGELDQKAWVLVRSDDHAARAQKVDKLWSRIMGSLGPDFKLRAAAPDDPALN